MERLVLLNNDAEDGVADQTHQQHQQVEYDVAPAETQVQYIASVAEFIDPDGGEIKSTSYWPVRLQPYAGVDFIPQSWIYEYEKNNIAQIQIEYYILNIINIGRTFSQGSFDCQDTYQFSCTILHAI